ncbi:MAG: ATP synthase F0 subunit C [Candidatus Alcyoniella australis]|nr:ATP synthase F0 subunit C [Candidatus Alcyoniella australis]
MNKRFATIMLAAMIGVLMFSTVAMAQEEGAEKLDPMVLSMAALAAGLGIAIAVLGGTMGQGRTMASAIEGIARNPGASGKIFTPMILGLALIESLVIYSLIISFILVGKL